MAERLRHHRYTYAQYVALETVSDQKHEFMDGEIYVLPSASAEHTRLSAQMIRFLGNAVADTSCEVFGTELRVHVEEVGLSTYSDGTVMCGETPAILVEVTSDSSEEYDTGLERQYYQTIESLREYIVVSHRERRITVHARGENGTWSTQTATTGERVAVPSLQTQLAVDEIYRNSAIT